KEIGEVIQRTVVGRPAVMEEPHGAVIVAVFPAETVATGPGLGNDHVQELAVFAGVGEGTIVDGRLQHFGDVAFVEHARGTGTGDGDRPDTRAGADGAPVLRQRTQVRAAQNTVDGVGHAGQEGRVRGPAGPPKDQFDVNVIENAPAEVGGGRGRGV